MDVCGACWVSLEPWTGPACQRCGIPFASAQALDSSLALCATCREEAFQFDLARSYGLYRGSLRAAILQLKFGRRQRMGSRLGELLAWTWEWVEGSCDREPPVVVPVPLHRLRERERGFNQAELLAWGLTRKVARQRGGHPPQVETNCVLRTRPTVPQTGLNLRARRENVCGVFTVVKPEKIRDRVVVLVDDVMTTGATASACAGALKSGGTRTVLVLTLARATPEFPDIGPRSLGMAVDDFGGERR